MSGAEVSREEFLAGFPGAAEVLDAVAEVVGRFGGCSVRFTRSQAAFRRRRAFAFLWMPGRYLAAPRTETVLSIALDREDTSSRWAEVVHPSPRTWLHHLDVRRASDIDDEVVALLFEAADSAT